MKPVNAAAKANVERVVAEEQQRASVRMGQIRFGVAAVLLTIQLAAPTRSMPALAPTIWGLVVFTAVSGLLLFATYQWRWASRFGAWAVPLLDVPMVAVIQAYQAHYLADERDGLQTAVAIPLALVTLSFLSLSRTVILVTAAAATVSILRRLLLMEATTAGLHLTVMMPGAVALIGLVVVSRVRALVLASRRRDLVGRYILGERVGSGGMAEVYSATYSPEGGFERRVAVKRILSSQLERPDAVALFRREAEIGAGLAHPNIVQVLDFGVEDDGFFIAMEFVDGAPLSRVLSLARLSGAPLPLPVCLFVLEQLATALDYLHTRTTATGSPQGLVHRDVNPPNVLVSRLGEVKLNDFGVARSDTGQRLTLTGEVRGKLGYIAPEQLEGRPVDARSDLWSLGVTAYELVTLHRPFEGLDDAALLRAMVEAPMPSVHQHRAGVSDELASLIDDLMARDPKARVPSAREALRRAAAIETDRAEGRRQLSTLVQTLRQTSGPKREASQ